MVCGCHNAFKNNDCSQDASLIPYLEDKCFQMDRHLEVSVGKDASDYCAEVKKNNPL